MGVDAIDRWRKKVDFLREEEAVATDPGEKFRLQEQIREAKDRIRDLENAEDSPKARLKNIVLRLLIIAIFGWGMAFLVEELRGRDVFPHSPEIEISRVSYTLNNSIPTSVRYDQTIEVREGDTFRIVDLWYLANRSGGKYDRVQAEAFMRAQGQFGDGRFTDSAAISAGEHRAGDFFGKEKSNAWTLDRTMDRVVIAAIHYRKCWNSDGCHGVDDRFFLNLRFIP